MRISIPVSQSCFLREKVVPSGQGISTSSQSLLLQRHESHLHGDESKLSLKVSLSHFRRVLCSLLPNAWNSCDRKLFSPYLRMNMKRKTSLAETAYERKHQSWGSQTVCPGSCPPVDSQGHLGYFKCLRTTVTSVCCSANCKLAVIKVSPLDGSTFDAVRFTLGFQRLL